MKVKLLALARKHFARDYIPQSTQRHNIRAYARAVHALGDKWLYAKILTTRDLKGATR
jgi:hypothetical protein